VGRLGLHGPPGQAKGERWVKVLRYRVYHKDNPSISVEVRADGYSPMDIKSRAIKQSDRFGWADYPSLRIERVRDEVER